jgi:hypothetical protein
MTVQHCVDAIGKVFLAVPDKKKMCDSGRELARAPEEGRR